MSIRDRRGELILEGQGTTYKDRLVYFEGVNLVGRNAAKTGITIKDRSISQIHAKIICKSNSIKIVDMKSKNGVYLNSLENQISVDIEVEINPKEDILYFAQIKCRFLPDADRRQNEQDTKQVTLKANKPFQKPTIEQKVMLIQQQHKQIVKQIPTKQKDQVNQEIKNNKKTKKQQMDKRQFQRRQKQKQQILKALINQQQANSTNINNQDKNIIGQGRNQKQKQQTKNYQTKDNMQPKKKGKKQSKQKIRNSKQKQKEQKKLNHIEPQEKSKQKEVSFYNKTLPNKEDQKKKSVENQQIGKQKQTNKNTKVQQKQQRKINENEIKMKLNKQKDQSKEKQKKQKRAQSGQTKIKGGNKRKNKSVGKIQENDKEKPLHHRKKLPEGLNESSFSNHPRRSFNQKTALISGLAMTFKPTIRINITQNWRDKFDVLVMQRYSRTFKLLYAICLGVPIVTLNWIVESEYRRGIVPFQRFYLQTPQKDLIMSSVQKVKNGHKVFKNLKFYLIEAEQNFHLPVEQIEALIQVGGGTVLKRFNKKQENAKQIIFILRFNNGPQDYKILRKIEGTQKIYTIQFILDGCLTQQIKWQQNKITKY